MVCEHCTKMSKDQFKKEISENQKKSRYDLVYFILNTLHLIVSNGYWYCYCSKENENKCKLCTIPIIFFDFEQDIDKNMFNLGFIKFTILGSAMSLDNYLMKIKAPSSAFFIKNMNSGGETEHLGKPGLSLSLSL